MVGGSFTGGASSNGYTLDYVMSDTEVNAECSYDISFADDVNFAAESNGKDVYVELVNNSGSTYHLDEGKIRTNPCFYMSGGSVRVMQEHFPKNKEIMQMTLPYINGANVSFKISKDASFVQETSFVEDAIKPVMQKFRAFSSSLF